MTEENEGVELEPCSTLNDSLHKLKDISGRNEAMWSVCARFAELLECLSKYLPVEPSQHLRHRKENFRSFISEFKETKNDEFSYSTKW